MKRSEINGKLKEAVAFFDEMGFRLPPWAFWSEAEWRKNLEGTTEIRDNSLGWDLTDFGSADFGATGLLLFTIRNGNHKDKRYRKPYAEKIMICAEGQVTPMHYHWSKMEDIINRGGGNFQIQLYNSRKDGSLDDTPVKAQVDGVTRVVPAGTVLTLTPGESITLTPGLYHKFWGEPGKGKVLMGEVSMVNDDANDNNFYEKCGRFPAIEEDEAPLHLLCTDYPRLQAA